VNLEFTPCDFEQDDLVSSLASVGFELDKPAVVSWLGVVLYLSREAMFATLSSMAALAPSSEVTLTYSEPPEATTDDPTIQEVRRTTRPVAAAAGETMIGYYTEREMDDFVRKAGFTHIDHHPIERLNERYYRNRADGLRLLPFERLLTAVL